MKRIALRFIYVFIFSIMHSFVILKLLSQCCMFFVTSPCVLFSFQYGPVFSFTMVGKTFTYLLGSDAAALLFNSKNEDLNAEDVYSRLTTPVFGKGVAYDVPNPVGDTVIP